MRHVPLSLLLLALVAPGCAVHSAAIYSPPPERATECRSYCGALDMRLAAVVIIMNSAGCVCEPRDAPLADGAGAASIGGGAAIQAMLEQQQRQAVAAQNPR